MLTFNTLFTGDVRPRLRALGTRLEESGYDLVCLQEVMYRRHARLLRRLAPSFTHHAYAGAVVLRGGLVLLSRRPITAARFHRFPRTPPVRPEYLMRKGAQVARVGDLTVLNTHLSARAQPAEFDRLRRWIAALDPAAPLVVAGDLNVGRGSPLLAGLLAAAGLVDVLAGDPRPTYRPTPQFPSPPAFDHVLVRGVRGRAGLVFQDEQVLLAGGRRAYLSDHYGVAAELG